MLFLLVFVYLLDLVSCFTVSKIKTALVDCIDHLGAA